MLIDQPQPEDLFPKFRDFIQDSVLVGHNARFDINFLRHEFQKLGLRLGNRCLCTLELSRKQHPQLPNHKLDTVCSHLLRGNDRGVRRHRALDDARLTARIWLKMTNHG
jgi:DNA polymerase-3 subunit epsilon